MAVDTQTLHGVDNLLDTLKSLPPQLVSRRGGPAVAALRKGGQVIRREWEAGIQAIIDAPNVSKAGRQSAGLLKGSVRVTRDNRPQRHRAAERVLVRILGKTYTDATGREKVTTSQVARLLEYGTEKRDPMAFASEGFMEARQKALDAVVTDLNASVARIIKKLEREAARKMPPVPGGGR